MKAQSRVDGTTKTCKVCLVSLPISDFPLTNNGTLVSAKCRTCTAAYHYNYYHQYRKDHPRKPAPKAWRPFVPPPPVVVVAPPKKEAVNTIPKLSIGKSNLDLTGNCYRCGKETVETKRFSGAECKPRACPECFKHTRTRRTKKEHK